MPQKKAASEAKGGGPPYALLAVVVGLAACLFHFRTEAAQKVLVLMPGEVEDLRPLVWANGLQGIGGGSSQGTCCYAADWKKLKQIFCSQEAGFDVLQHALPMLGQCTAYVRGRAENPIETFNRGGFQGSLTQRSDGTYLIKDASLTDAADGVKGVGDSASCKAIERCIKAKSSDARCRDIRKSLGEC